MDCSKIKTVHTHLTKSEQHGFKPKTTKHSFSKIYLLPYVANALNPEPRILGEWFGHETKDKTICVSFVSTVSENSTSLNLLSITLEELWRSLDIVTESLQAYSELSSATCNQNNVLCFFLI
jgi:hypothetical protein